MEVMEFEKFADECEQEFRDILREDCMHPRRKLFDLLHRIEKSCCSNFERDTIKERLVGMLRKYEEMVSVV